MWGVVLIKKLRKQRVLFIKIDVLKMCLFDSLRPTEC